MPELDSGNHIAALAPASVPRPHSPFGAVLREEATMRVQDPITEEASRDVAMLLAIAYERHAAATAARLEHATHLSADSLDKSDTSSGHGQ